MINVGKIEAYFLFIGLVCCTILFSGTSYATGYSRDLIFSDHEQRISDEFTIPKGLYNRTAFWFDVYTKYSVQEHILHHKEFPWIVFGVVDTRPVLEKYKDHKNKWTKFHKSEQLVKAERTRIKKTLLKLSKKKHFNNLNPEEKALYELLLEIPGKNRKKIILSAVNNIRSQLGQREYIERGLSYSNKYLPYMESIFKEKNIPVELTRMPFVESSFNTEAESKVGASGIWQFMPATGRQFLKVGEHIDERNSPQKSTVAAAKLLKQYKRILNKWPLAITAYNHGVGSLKEAIKKTNSSDIVYLINNYKSRSFGFASSNFYTSFLAILYAEKYKNEIFNSLELSEVLSFKELKLKKSIRVSSLIKLLEIDPEKFKKLNKDISAKSYRSNIWLPKGFRIHLPEPYVEKLNNHFALLKPISRNL